MGRLPAGELCARWSNDIVTAAIDQGRTSNDRVVQQGTRAYLRSIDNEKFQVTFHIGIFAAGVLM